MLRQEKQSLVEDVQERLKGSSIALCADYRGITVAQVSGLRREMRACGARVSVVKNTLIRRAVNFAFSGEEEVAVKSFLGVLEGPTLLITNNDDPIAPTKILANYADKIESLKIKGAFFEGGFLTDARVMELSKMPGKEELLSSLLRVIMAPATNLVRLVNEPGSQFVRLVAAHEKNLS
jgi:large subunit ribosomal protein L10